jgi:hypothetical protein
MSVIWRTIRGYVLWTHERGSFHYDVMVTMILLFLFVTPHFVNFKDKPIEPHPTGTVTMQKLDGDGRFLAVVDASVIKAKDDVGIRDALQRVVAQFAGEVEIERYEAQRDNHGQVTAFKVWVRR